MEPIITVHSEQDVSSMDQSWIQRLPPHLMRMLTNSNLRSLSPQPSTSSDSSTVWLTPKSSALPATVMNLQTELPQMEESESHTSTYSNRRTESTSTTAGRYPNLLPRNLSPTTFHETYLAGRRKGFSSTPFVTTSKATRPSFGATRKIFKQTDSTENKAGATTMNNDPSYVAVSQPTTGGDPATNQRSSTDDDPSMLLFTTMIDTIKGQTKMMESFSQQQNMMMPTTIPVFDGEPNKYRLFKLQFKNQKSVKNLYLLRCPEDSTFIPDWPAVGKGEQESVRQHRSSRIIRVSVTAIRRRVQSHHRSVNKVEQTAGSSNFTCH